MIISRRRNDTKRTPRKSLRVRSWAQRKGQLRSAPWLARLPSDNDCCAFFFSVFSVNSLLFRVSISAQKRFKSWLLPEKGQMHLFVSRFFRFSKKREKRRKKEKTGENRRFSAPDLLRPDALWCAVGLDLSRIKRDLFPTFSRNRAALINLANKLNGCNPWLLHLVYVHHQVVLPFSKPLHTRESSVFYPFGLRIRDRRSETKQTAAAIPAKNTMTAEIAVTRREFQSGNKFIVK